MRRNAAERNGHREPNGERDAGATSLVLQFPMAVVQGGLYVACLPVVSLATAAHAIWRRVLGGIALHARRSISFGWRPTEAYLAGKIRRKRRGSAAKERAG